MLKGWMWATVFRFVPTLPQQHLLVGGDQRWLHCSARVSSSTEVLNILE